MKISAFIPLLFCIFLSCNNAPSSTTNTKKASKTPSTQIDKKAPQAKIDSYIKTIKLVKNKMEKESSFSKEDIKYDVETVHLEKLLIKLTAKYAKNNYQYEEIFYVRNDALVMYQSTKMSTGQKEGESTKLSANKIYLDNYKIIEVLEKSKESQPGGDLSLMDEYFMPITVNRDSLQAELNKQLTFLKENL